VRGEGGGGATLEMDWFERRGCEDETKDCVPAYEAHVFDPTLNLEWPSPLILGVYDIQCASWENNEENNKGE
jgi:hypothetical protein